MNKLSKGEWSFQVFLVALMIALMLVTVYPLWYVIVASFSDNTQVIRSGGLMFWPKGFNVNAYKQVLLLPTVWSGYRNTLFILVVGTTLNIVLTAIGGYFLSRKNVLFRKAISLGIIFTMYFSGGLIPLYFTVSGLGLRDSLAALILPVALNTFHLIIMTTAFRGVPDSLEESARLDGARHHTILFRIMLPLCMPTVAVLILYYGVGHWNSWFNAMIFLEDRRKFPLQLILREIVLYNTTKENAATALDREEIGETIQYATIVVATLPILCIYPFMQKYFAAGVMVGAVKG